MSGFYGSSPEGVADEGLDGFYCGPPAGGVVTDTALDGFYGESSLGPPINSLVVRAEEAATEAEASAVAAQVSADAAEVSKVASQGFADNSQASALSSGASASASQSSALESEASRVAAGVSETNADASELLAQQWATNPEDVIVSGGQYSSFHWAQKAEDAVTSKVSSVSGTAPIVSSGGITPAISITAATTSAAGSMSASDKTKLDGVATGANNYVHPASHPPSIITQDASNRFFTDTERTKLSGIATGAQVNVATNIAQGTRTATTVPVTSSTGTGATLGVATTSLAGVMSSADKTKLDGIAAGAQVNVATDLSLGTITATAIPINSSTGADISLPVATTSLAGLQSAADKTKLDGVATGANNYTHPANHPPSIITQDASNRFFTDTERTKLTGIATGATANSADATLLARANHTGTQLASTISDFASSARAQTEAELIAGTNVTITPSGTGATRQLTIAATVIGGTGDVVGPASSADNNIALFSGATGKIIKTGPTLQTNYTDSTTGAITGVGSFGLGGILNAPIIADANSTASMQSGFFRWSHGTTLGTSPTGAAFNGALLVERFNNSTIIKQTITAVVGGSTIAPRTWVRTSSATDTWCDWYEQASYTPTNTTNLNTATVNGFFKCTDTAVGVPGPAYLGWYVESISANGLFLNQKATAVGATQVQYSRSSLDGGSTWSQWYQVAVADSPALTGTPTAPTATAGTNTTQLATTAFVQTASGSSTSSQSLVKNGYAVLKGGLIIQWGTFAVSATATTITFPIAFPTACRAISQGFNWTGVTSRYAAAVDSVGVSSFIYRIPSVANISTGHWIAVGH